MIKVYYSNRGRQQDIINILSPYSFIMFKKHLESHGIGYFDHQKLAFFFAKESFKASIMAFMHGIIPNMYETSASDLHKEIIPRYMKKLEKMQKDHK